MTEKEKMLKEMLYNANNDEDLLKYAQLLPQCERAYVTKIYQTYPADTAFPNLDENPDWELEEKGEMQEEKGVRFSFDVYKKR